MNRQRFINFIAPAIIGTAIALKLPDGLVPLNHLTERPRITFAALMDAYNKAKESGEEPCVLLLSKPSMDDARDMMRGGTARLYNATNGEFSTPFFHFRDATVIDWEIPDDVIQVHSRNGVIKEYYFA